MADTEQAEVAAPTVINQRGSLQFHGNVWTEEFVLSLASPYPGTQYLEQVESLVAEIKEMIKAQFQRENPQSNLIERLQLVDAFHSLGVQKHFTQEIKHALDYVHKFWDESKGIGFGSRNNPLPDLLCTALAFRLLRINRYPIAAGAIETFKRDGLCFETKIHEAEDEMHVRSLLNLFRASSLAFPEDIILQRAEDFSRGFLENWLKNKQKENLEDSLSKEVKHLLVFPWHYSPTLWDAINYMDIYQSNQDWLRSSLNEKILKLARLDFNIKQVVFQEEMKDFMRWWMDEDVPKFNHMRLRPIESYFYSCLCVPPEPEFRALRLYLTKTSIVAGSVDDTADNYATWAEFHGFYEALQKWDHSMVEAGAYTDEINAVLKFTINTVNEITVEANKKQQHDTEPCIKHTWLQLARAYMKEFEWNEKKQIPSFHAYLQENLSSAGFELLACSALVFMEPNFNLDKYASIFYLGSMLVRLSDDLRDFSDPKKADQLVNLVNCYMKHNPAASSGDACNYIKGLIRNRWMEVNHWYFSEQGKNIPMECKTLCYDLCRAILFALRLVDGFTFTDTIVKEQVTKILFVPA